jgi:hypothetical protein
LPITSNGKIGFKITPPSFTFYEGVTLINGDNNTWEASDGVFKVNWTAYNIVDTEYKISRADDRWVLIRDGQVVSSGTSELDDGFINISVPVDKFSPYDYTISVDSDDFGVDAKLGSQFIHLRKKCRGNR